VGKTVTRLRDGKETAQLVLKREHELGEVTTITRNDEVVLEVTAVANAPRPPRAAPAEENKDAAKPEAPATAAAAAPARPVGDGGSPGFFGGPIDLRPSFSRWQFAFAVAQPGREGKVRRSFQFFDEHGTAVHKIYVNDEAGIAAFDQLVGELRAPDQNAPIATKAADAKVAEKADAEIDRAGLLAAWDGITNVHQFGGLLKKFNVSREQALRLGGTERAYQVDLTGLRTLLDEAAKDGTPIMAFVGNNGLTQIYTGPITKTEASGPWYNVLDPKLNVHIHEPGLASVWVVKKPSTDGILTAIEVYNREGEIVIQFYSKRERRQPESAAWHKIIAALPALKV
jgi:putative hemin transport protein